MDFFQHYTDIAIRLAPSQIYIYVCSALLSVVMGSVLIAVFFGALRQSKWIKWLAVALFLDAVYLIILAFLQDLAGAWFNATKIILWAGIAISLYLALTDVIFGLDKKLKNGRILLITCLIAVGIEVFLSKYSFHRLPLAIWAGWVLWFSARKILLMTSFWFQQTWRKFSVYTLVGIGWFIFLLGLLLPGIVLSNNGFAWHDTTLDPHIFPILSQMDLLLYALFSLFKLLCFLIVITILFRMLRGLFSDTEKTSNVNITKIDDFDDHYREGLLGNIGKELNANYVEMTIRLVDGSYLWYGWFDNTLRKCLSENNWQAFSEWQDRNKTDDSCLFKPEFYQRIMEPDKPLALTFDYNRGALSNLYRKDQHLVFGSCEKRDFDYLPFIPGLKTFMAVPVMFQDKVIGTLGVESQGELAMGSFLLQRLQSYSTVLSIPMKNIREMRTLHAFVDQMEGSLVEVKDLKSLVQEFAEKIKTFFYLKAVGFQIEIGCARLFAFHDAQGQMVIHSLALDDKGKVKGEGSLNDFLKMHPLDQRFKSPLELKHSGPTSVLSVGIGYLHLVRTESQQENWDLVCSPLLSKFISDYVANLVLRIIRMDFQERISKYWSALAQVTCGPDQWLEAVRNAFASHCGLYVQSVYLSAPIGEKWVASIDITATEDYTCELEGRGYRVFRKGIYQFLLIALPNEGQLYICHRVAEGDITLKLNGSPWASFLEDIHRVTAAYFERMNQQELQLSLLAAERDALRGVVQNLSIHELKNAALRLNSMAYEAKEEANTKQATLIEQLYEESKKFSRIANELNKPLVSEDKESYLLSELLALIKRYLDYPLSKYQIELVLTSDLKITVINFTVMHMVLLNLVNNAIEALRRRAGVRIITIDTVFKQGRCLCRVVDNGPGVAIDLRPRLFQPGFSTAKTHSGVGLAGCRQLLRAHQADLWYDESYTQGARFCIEFKQQREEQCSRK